MTLHPRDERDVPDETASGRRCVVCANPVAAPPGLFRSLTAGALGLLLGACQQPLVQPELEDRPVPPTTSGTATGSGATQSSDTDPKPRPAVQPAPEPRATIGAIPEAPTAIPPPGAGAAPTAHPPPRRRTASGGHGPHYDPANPRLALLQKPDDALHGMPIDSGGEINWSAALDQRLIAPRASLAGKESMQVLDLDIVMKNTRAMPAVRFPHRPHTEWLACKNCHERIFVSAAGRNKISMQDIFLGKYCGVCHDKVAFSTYDCERCHSVPTSNP